MTASDVLFSVVAVVGLAAIGLLAAAALRIPDKAGFVVAALTLIAASVVLVSTALSFAELYWRGPFLAGELAVLIAAAAAWWASGRPRPPAGWLQLLSIALAGARRHRSVALIAAAATVAFVVEAVLAIGVVPNNFDSMTYHLSRAAYWLQRQL